MSRQTSMPRGGSTGLPAYDASTHVDLDSFEIGAWCLVFAVVSLPAVIVGGIYLGYQMFVSWSGLPS